jgi:hypothetical protein
LTVASLPGERWKIIHFKSLTKNKDYFISNLGRLKRRNHKDQKEAILQGSIDNRGRKMINVALQDGGFDSKYVHHLVAQAFVLKKDADNSKIIHLDYNPLNNQHVNLKWVDKNTWRRHRRSNPYKKLYERKT